MSTLREAATRDEEGIDCSVNKISVNSLEIDKFRKLDNIIYNTQRKNRNLLEVVCKERCLDLRLKDTTV